MGTIKKIEGGSGGKKGHSNMSHRDGTEEIKKETKKLRREYGKKQIEKDLTESAKAKFIGFLESIKTKQNASLLEAVGKAFKICLENEYDDDDQLDDRDNDHDDDDGDDRSMFADPGGNSALRAASEKNPRNLPCPTCKSPNRLTREDRHHGYQCNSCADASERGGY